MSDIETKDTQELPVPRPASPRVPKNCASCRFSTRLPIAGGLVELFVCGHPKSFEIKGGMLALDVWEEPPDDCPFVHNDQKYEGKPIRRWFFHRLLRRAKKVTPPTNIGGGGNP